MFNKIDDLSERLIWKCMGSYFHCAPKYVDQERLDKYNSMYRRLMKLRLDRKNRLISK